MSAMSVDIASQSLEERVKALCAKDLCVDLASIRGGNAIHTSFGYGPEFWLLPQSISPDDVLLDFKAQQVVGARLIVSENCLVSNPDLVRAQGATLTLCLPCF